MIFFFPLGNNEKFTHDIFIEDSIIKDFKHDTKENI